MTEKQRQFADEYLIDCNSTRAYRAVYTHIKSDAVAAANGSRLLRNAKIKAYLDKKLDAISDEKTADAAEVMRYLTTVLRGESRSAVCVVEGGGNGYTTAKIIQKPPDEKERLKAAELLGKRYGLYTEKLDVSTDVPVLIAGEGDLQ